MTLRQIKKIVVSGTALNHDEVRHPRAAKAPVTRSIQLLRRLTSETAARQLRSGCAS